MTEAKKDKGRISIAGRIVPGVSFMLAALGGVYSAYSIISLFEALRKDSTATIHTVEVGLGVIMETNATILILAGIIIAVWIMVLFMMRESGDAEASLPGSAYVLAAVPTLVPTLLTAYAITLILSAFRSTAKTDFGALGAYVAQISLVAIAAGAVSLLPVIALTFVPFRGRTGWRMSTVIGLGVITVAFIALAAFLFSIVGTALETTNSVGA